MVHPVIVVEVVKQIRQAIIKLSNFAKSKIEKESKEAQLYDFITSDNFVGLIEENQFQFDYILNLQEKEEKDHQMLWKQKKNYLEKIGKYY